MEGINRRSEVELFDSTVAAPLTNAVAILPKCQQGGQKRVRIEIMIRFGLT